MRNITRLTKKAFFIIGLLSAISAYSQKEAKLYEEAEEALNANNFKKALSFYQQVSAIDPKYQDIEYKMEVCYLLTPSGDDRPLQKLLDLKSYGEKDEHYYYWLGKVYTHRYMIGEAIDAFDLFAQKVSFTGNEDVVQTRELLAHAKQLKDFFDNPDDFEIHQLESPVNSPAAELTPVYSKKADELLFASNRNGSGEQAFKIYYTKSGPNGWTPVQEIKNLGTFTRSNANIEVVNEDGKLFIFKEENGGDLFFSQPSGDTWTTPVEFDSKVSNNDIASHFFINEHEDRIIFASDERGTGLDIYESFKDPEDGKWSKPQPFHSAINSRYSEDSPYLSPDETKLYFCSDRPGGVGGYDVYVSTYDAKTFSWSEPKNMGWPINSPDDEFHFKMNEDQNSGYFVSNRLHTKGDYDIYFFWHIEKVKIEGRIFDQKVNGPLADAEIRFHPSQYLDEYFGSKIDETGRYSTSIISDEIFSVEIIVQGNVVHTEKFEIHESGKEATTHIKDFTVN